ncbi:MAG: hypothetical protein PVF54_04995 [Anaerolineae bacterium]|jgi:hypothetical protein
MPVAQTLRRSSARYPLYDGWSFSCVAQKTVPSGRRGSLFAPRKLLVVRVGAEEVAGCQRH